MKPGKLFVISAPSGGGKTSLVNALLGQEPFKSSISRVVTYTTRSPRPGDVNGYDYHFVRELEFIELSAKGFFIEWSIAYGTYYGTPASALDDIAQGSSRIVILDRDGARNIAKAYPQAILIWIAPPSLEVLESRLRARNTENGEQIKRRLALATQEMDEEAQNPQYSHHILNDFFENSLNFLKNIVIFSLNLKK
jgi:guanylate kinase